MECCLKVLIGRSETPGTTSKRLTVTKSGCTDFKKAARHHLVCTGLQALKCSEWIWVHSMSTHNMTAATLRIINLLCRLLMCGKLATARLSLSIVIVALVLPPCVDDICWVFLSGIAEDFTVIDSSSFHHFSFCYHQARWKLLNFIVKLLMQ